MFQLNRLYFNKGLYSFDLDIINYFGGSCLIEFTYIIHDDHYLSRKIALCQGLRAYKWQARR